MTIKHLTTKQIPDITMLHIKTFEGDFLPLLGKNFLNTLYTGVIGKKNIYGFFAEEKGEMVGFILGTKNMKLFFNTAIKSKLAKLIYYLLSQIIQQPQIIKNIFQTLLYPKKDTGAKAELIIVAISRNWQAQGIGKKLVYALEDKFRNEKIRRYKLTVHANKKAIGFYDKLGFKQTGQFTLYNKLWHIYEKRFK